MKQCDALSLPKDWEIAEFENCLEKVTYTNKIQRKDFKEEGIYPIVSQEKDLINGYWDNEDDLYKVDKPIVIFGDHTQVIKFVDFDFVLGADGVKVLNPKEKIDPKYFYYFLQNIDLGSLGYARHYRLLKEINVAYPKSLPEQQRIVAILDRCFTAIDRAKAIAEQNLKNAKELFESYLNGVFENINEKIEFGEVCELIGGSQPSKDEFIYEPRDGYIRLIQVRDYRTDKFQTYIPYKLAKRFCNKKDIMIGRYGPPIFGIFRGLEGAYNVALMKVVENKNYIESDYFYWFLQNNSLREFVEQSSKRAVGQDGVRKELLEKYPVPVPSKSTQQTIVSQLDALRSETQRLEKHYTLKIADLDELKKSILQKAFNGELNTAKLEIV